MCRLTAAHRVCFRLIKKKNPTLTHPSVTKSLKTNMLPKTTENESLNHLMTHFLKHVHRSENSSKWTQIAGTDDSEVGEIKCAVISCHSPRSDHVSLLPASFIKSFFLLCDTVTPTTLWLPSFMPSAAVRQTVLSQWTLRHSEEVQRKTNHRHTCFSTWLHLDSVLPTLTAQEARQDDYI